MTIEETVNKILQDGPPELINGYQLVPIDLWSWRGTPFPISGDWDIKTYNKIHKAIESNLGEALTSNVSYIREYAQWRLKNDS